MNIPKWQYMTRTLNLYAMEAKELNQLGSLGWELCGVVRTEGGTFPTYPQYIHFFKRPVEIGEDEIQG